jgi:Putative prokaryotic signal transducing protein
VDDLVVVEAVPTVMEAGIVCGLLRDAGIECYDRPTNFAVAAMDGWPSAGPREIVFRGEDADKARTVLEQQRR